VRALLYTEAAKVVATKNCDDADARLGVSATR
jgi:hypothetical protein